MAEDRETHTHTHIHSEQQGSSELEQLTSITDFWNVGGLMDHHPPRRRMLLNLINLRPVATGSQWRLHQYDSEAYWNRDSSLMRLSYWYQPRMDGWISNRTESV